MGAPIFDWKKIPLSKEMNNKNLKIIINDNEDKTIEGGFSLSIGNPHLVFFVSDLSKFNITKIGSRLENHNFFPEKCNVTLASVKNKKYVQVKVWERGAGLTKACGTAACAAVVSGAILKINERCADIEFSEGILNINWKIDNNIYMTGKVSEIKKIMVNI
jgi:diaminopimelate epimerase